MKIHLNYALYPPYGLPKDMDMSTYPHFRSDLYALEGVIRKRGYRLYTHDTEWANFIGDPDPHGLLIIFWEMGNPPIRTSIKTLLSGEGEFNFLLPVRMNREIPKFFFKGGSCINQLVRYYRMTDEVMAAIERLATQKMAMA